MSSLALLTLSPTIPLNVGDTLISLKAPSPACQVPGHDIPTPPISVSAIFRTYRWRMALTYALFNVENLLNLARPWVVGLAINDLLRTSYRGALILIVQHLAFVILSAFRQRYDTRVFTAIYAGLVARLVIQQRARQVDISRVAARSALSREIVDFFEHNVPFVFQLLYALVGSIVMLAFCDKLLTPLCLALVPPVYWLSRRYARQSLVMNHRLNDQTEREVAVVGRADAAEVERHYRRLAQWRVRLSDLQAGSFCLMNALALLPVAVALTRCCAVPAADAGQIFAVLGYVMMFVLGLTNLPALIQQLSRLHDINGRVTDYPDHGQCA